MVGLDGPESLVEEVGLMLLMQTTRGELTVTISEKSTVYRNR